MNKEYKVYKYPVGEITDEYSIEIPDQSMFLKVAMQADSLTFWYLVPMVEDFGLRTDYYNLYGTGHPLVILNTKRELKHIDTIFHDSFVWHIFLAKNYKKEF